MKINSRRIGVSLSAVLGAGLLYLLFKPEVVAVEVAEVGLRTLTVVVEEQGRTRARDPFVVAAPITGRLLRPELEAGDRVAEGQLIARIAVAPDDVRTAAMSQANLIAAEARRTAVAAALLEAESAHARALREEERREELFKTQVVTAEEREHYRQLTDAAESRLLSARASLQAAEADVESARSLLLGSGQDNDRALRSISAPVAGTVYQVFEENERVVQAGAPLYSISRDDVLEVVVDLLTQDAVQVSSGQPMLISGWGGSDILQGDVLRIEPQAFTKISALGVEEQRVNVIGSLRATPPALGAEYRIDVAIVVWEADGVLAVPTSAVFQRSKRWHAFVVSDGRARLRELRVGRRNRDYVQVLDGVAAGDRVILFPSDLVVDGVRVRAEQ